MRADRVLLVEDSPIWINQLRLCAETSQMEVVGFASSPAEAISRYEETRPSIVLLDIHLKGGSGIQVLEALQSKLSETRFVVFTAHPSAQLRQACARLGAWAVVDKADSLSELNTCFEQVRFPAQ